MTAYADCLDARWMFEWYSAKEYERRADIGDERDHHPKLANSAESALLFYLLFWAKVANDL